MTVSQIIKQKSYERVERVLRRHPITFLPSILLFFVLLFIPAGISMLIRASLPAFFDIQTFYVTLVLIGSLYLLFGLLFFYGQFVDYYLDIWVVTNDRIVNVEQHGLFGRVISELDLYRVQDVTSEIRGVIGSIFRFGSVYVQSAGETRRFHFRQVHDPHAIRKLILDMVQEDRKYHVGP